MTVRVNKSSFNIREKLSELGRKFGLKGSELAAAETVQEARDLVSAGRKNIVINGDMRVSERATSATGIGAAFSYYTLDRYQFRSSGHGGRYTMSQSATNPGEGFSKSLKFEVTTADSSVASAEYAGFSTRFEGQDVQQFAFGSSKAKPLTLSFWVKSSVTGTYSVFFANWWSSTGRLINRTFTINSSDTWEKKVLTIPGDTNSNNSIPEDNSAGMEIGWTFTSGTTYNDGSDGSVWHNSSDAGKRHYGHEVNFADTVGNTFYITGIQLEVGRNATEFEHRSYGEELALCQRYYQKKRIGYGRVAHFRTDAILVFAADLPVELRASAGSITQNSGLNNWAYRDGVSPTISSIQSNNSSASGTTLTVLYSVGAGGDSDETCFYYGGGSILIDAEL